MQLATYENVYLLDMVALHNTGQPEIVKGFFTALLCGRDVLKLGELTIDKVDYTLFI